MDKAQSIQKKIKWNNTSIDLLSLGKTLLNTIVMEIILTIFW